MATDKHEEQKVDDVTLEDGSADIAQGGSIIAHPPSSFANKNIQAFKDLTK